MPLPDRDLLAGRIRQLRRAITPPDRPEGAAGDDRAASELIPALEARVAHLERLVEGLQDSVYRESERHESLIAELQAQVVPATMRAALADDARNRGL